MYADFTFYSVTFYGDTIPEDKFDKYATRASDYIDYLTWKKAQSYDDTENTVKKCCCALAEQYQSIDALKAAANAKVTADGIISSESVGSHSRSFKTGGDVAQEITAEEAKLAAIARRYLLPTGLLYRGVNTCVHTAHCHNL